MSILHINTGTSANKGDGDSIRLAFHKVNLNFSEVVRLTEINTFTSLTVTTTGTFNDITATNITVLNTATINNLTVGGTFNVGQLQGFDDFNIIKNDASGLFFRIRNTDNESFSAIQILDGFSGGLTIRHQNLLSASPSFDSGQHYIYGNTPFNVLNIGRWANLNFYANAALYTNPLAPNIPSITIQASDGRVIVNKDINIDGDIIPQADALYDLGSPFLQWRSLYVSTSTIYIGGVPVSVSDNKLTVDGVEVGTGGGGVGYTGSAGITGYTGSFGATGFTGSQGDQGIIGYTGSFGATGFTGSQGDQGIIGYTGSVGPMPTLTSVTSHVIPSADLTYDLGSTSSQWRSLYVGTSTIYLGGTALSVSGGNLTIDGSPVSGGGGSGSTLVNGTYTFELTTAGNAVVPNIIKGTTPGGITLAANYTAYIVTDYGDNNRTWTFDGSSGETILPNGTIIGSDGNVNTIISVPGVTTGTFVDWAFEPNGKIVLPNLQSIDSSDPTTLVVGTADAKLTLDNFNQAALLQAKKSFVRNFSENYEANFTYTNVSGQGTISITLTGNGLYFRTLLQRLADQFSGNLQFPYSYSNIQATVNPGAENIVTTVTNVIQGFGPNDYVMEVNQLPDPDPFTFTDITISYDYLNTVGVDVDKDIFGISTDNDDIDITSGRDINLRATDDLRLTAGSILELELSQLDGQASTDGLEIRVSNTLTTHNWIYRFDGVTQLPSGLTASPISNFVPVNGTVLQQTENEILQVLSKGLSGGMTIGWAENPFEPSKVAALTFNATAEQVRIATGSYTGTVHTWAFDQTGTLVFPDGTTSTGAIVSAAQSSSFIIQTLGSAQASPSNVLSVFEFGVDGTVTLPGGGVIDGADYDVTISAGDDGSSTYGHVTLKTNGPNGVNEFYMNSLGELNLPRGGVIQETDVTNEAFGTTTTSLTLVPAGAANGTQRLEIYGTAGGEGNHIHITSGNQNQTDLYLGNDTQFFAVGAMGQIEVRARPGLDSPSPGTGAESGSPVWIYAGDAGDNGGNTVDGAPGGDILLQSGVSSTGLGGEIILISANGPAGFGSVKLSTDGGSSHLEFDQNNTLTFPSGGGIIFDSSATSTIAGVGEVIFADGTTQTSAWLAGTVSSVQTTSLTTFIPETGTFTNTNQLSVSHQAHAADVGFTFTIDYQSPLDETKGVTVGAINTPLILSTGSVKVRANLSTSTEWTFGTGGGLTFPDGTTQTTAFTGVGGGGGVTSLTAGTGTFVSSTSGAVTIWVGNTSNLEETFESKTTGTGVMVFDCTTNRLFYQTGLTGNITPNFTNLDLTTGEATSISLVVVQGATGRSVSGVQIAGTTTGVTLVWQGSASAPAGNASRTDVFSFSILCTATNAYTVLGMLTSFGGV